MENGRRRPQDQRAPMIYLARWLYVACSDWKSSPEAAEIAAAGARPSGRDVSGDRDPLVDADAAAVALRFMYVQWSDWTSSSGAGVGEPGRWTARYVAVGATGNSSAGRRCG